MRTTGAPGSALPAMAILEPAAPSRPYSSPACTGVASVLPGASARQVQNAATAYQHSSGSWKIVARMAGTAQTTPPRMASTIGSRWRTRRTDRNLFRRWNAAQVMSSCEPALWSETPYHNHRQGADSMSTADQIPSLSAAADGPLSLARARAACVANSPAKIDRKGEIPSGR